MDGTYFFKLVKKWIHTRSFTLSERSKSNGNPLLWTLPVLGALIITSPLPDELRLSLMGISKLKTYQFILLSFTFNAIGIFLIVSAGILLKP